MQSSLFLCAGKATFRVSGWFPGMHLLTAADVEDLRAPRANCPGVHVCLRQGIVLRRDWWQPISPLQIAACGKAHA